MKPAQTNPSWRERQVLALLAELARERCVGKRRFARHEPEEDARSRLYRASGGPAFLPAGSGANSRVVGATGLHPRCRSLSGAACRGTALLRRLMTCSVCQTSLSADRCSGETPSGLAPPCQRALCGPDLCPPAVGRS